MDEPTILVVEDEPITAMEIRTMLENLSYEVLAVKSSGKDALEILQEEPADLILMDVNLDGIMDGIETAKTVRENYTVPIVYLTAYSDEETLERARETEPEGYLVKPITEDDLRSTVKMALNRDRNKKSRN